MNYASAGMAPPLSDSVVDLSTHELDLVGGGRNWADILALVEEGWEFAKGVWDGLNAGPG